MGLPAHLDASRDPTPPGAPPLPDGWFATRDAVGQRVWCHVKTQHSVRHRPTDATPIAPAPSVRGDAPRSALPPCWFETRAADGSVIWRNAATMEVSRRRPGGAGGAGDAADDGSPTKAINSGQVWIPGRDAPKASRADVVAREIQMRRAHAQAQAFHTQSQQLALSPSRRRMG